MTAILPWTWTFLCSVAAVASAFQAHAPTPPAPPRHAFASRTALGQASHAAIDIAEGAPRDVAALRTWAANYGVQTADGFQLAADADGRDVYAMTERDVPRDSPLLCVPCELVLTGRRAREELGSAARGAERMLLGSDAADRVAQFYLFAKVIREYELGDRSDYYAWLDSLPRYYSNGASMTEFCFGCLPPYAAGVALLEKTRLRQFVEALQEVDGISFESKQNADLTRWAFAVVHTRYMEMPDGDVCLVPMGDYFNHGGAETEACISFDEQNNCYAYSTRDVPAGQPLRICYGDATNPSRLLARYGFLDASSYGTFCKIVVDDPSPELLDMGCDPSRMLFYNDGGIAQEVWDVVLFQELGESREEQRAFYAAHVAGDAASKQGLHARYFSRTLPVLQKHVDYLVNELDELSEHSWKKDVERHPRLPLLMEHNEVIKRTFELVQQNLDNMAMA